MTENSVIARSETPLSAAVDGEIVIFHPQEGAYFSLGRIGSRIWELAEEPITVGQLRATLTDEYDVDPQRCETEVLGFLHQLQAAGLVDVDG